MLGSTAISLIPKVLSHFKQYGSKMILVVPEWKSAAYWPFLCKTSPYFDLIKSYCSIPRAAKFIIPGSQSNLCFSKPNYSLSLRAFYLVKDSGHCFWEVGFFSQQRSPVKLSWLTEMIYYFLTDRISKILIASFSEICSNSNINVSNFNIELLCISHVLSCLKRPNRYYLEVKRINKVGLVFSNNRGVYQRIRTNNTLDGRYL